jgi:hypothetical protein
VGRVTAWVMFRGRNTVLDVVWKGFLLLTVITDFLPDWRSSAAGWLTSVPNLRTSVPNLRTSNIVGLVIRGYC